MNEAFDLSSLCLAIPEGENFYKENVSKTGHYFAHYLKIDGPLTNPDLPLKSRLNFHCKQYKGGK